MSMREDVIRDFQRYRKITKPASKQRFRLYAEIKKRIIYMRKYKARALRSLQWWLLKETYTEEGDSRALRNIEARSKRGRAA